MIQDLLLKQKNTFESSISLIPSENYAFYEDFKQVLDTDLNNRYSFFSNPIFTRAFPWHTYVQELEGYVIEKLSRLFKAKHINISPLSWMNALEIFFISMGNPWDHVAIISPRNGGHVSTIKIAENLWYNILYIPFLEDNTIDYNGVDGLCSQHDVKFIYIDQMNGVTPISLAPIKHIPAIKYYDISHNAAFIASGHHKNPLDDWYDCFGWSTHKSFPWPQKAFFATSEQEIHNKISSKTLSSISNNHIWNIVFLGITLERMEGHWERYIENVISNNRYFAQKLQEMWAIILWNNSQYSDNHQLFFYFPSDNQWVFQTLWEIWIYLNLLPLPFTDSGTVWFRTWVQELSFLWWTVSDLDIILWIISEVLSWTVDIEASQIKIKDLKENLLHKFKHLYD